MSCGIRESGQSRAKGRSCPEKHNILCVYVLDTWDHAGLKAPCWTWGFTSVVTLRATAWPAALAFHRTRLLTKPQLSRKWLALSHGKRIPCLESTVGLVLSLCWGHPVPVIFFSVLGLDLTCTQPTASICAVMTGSSGSKRDSFAAYLLQLHHHGEICLVDWHKCIWTMYQRLVPLPDPACKITYTGIFTGDADMISGGLLGQIHGLAGKKQSETSANFSSAV